MTGPLPIATYQPWFDDALCAQVDGDLWFPGSGEPAVDARRICGHCPVQAECLEYALDRNEQFGIWGGTNEKERRVLRRERRKEGTT